MHWEGAGPRAASSVNPFKRGPDWNLTEQMKLTKRDPKLAERLKASMAGNQLAFPPFLPVPFLTVTVTLNVTVIFDEFLRL